MTFSVEQFSFSQTAKIFFQYKNLVENDALLFVFWIKSIFLL